MYEFLDGWMIATEIIRTGLGCFVIACGIKASFKDMIGGAALVAAGALVLGGCVL